MKWLLQVQQAVGLFHVVRTPLQIALLTYIGAGGLAGIAIVGGVMLSPAGEAVQQAVAPARAYVESIMPGPMPTLFQMPPGQAVASQPAVPSRPVSAPGPIAEIALPTVDDAPGQDEDVASGRSIQQVRVTAALQPAQLAVQPGQADQPGPPNLDVRPVAGIGGMVPVAPGVAAAVSAAPGGSRSEIAAEVAARATAGPATRVLLGRSGRDIQRVATAASPTAIPAHAPSLASTEPSATVPTLPTEGPTSIPTIPATQVPTAAPTKAPTAEATKAPTRGPTHEPKETAAPTQGPAKGSVPPRPAKPSDMPAHPVPAAPPAKAEHPTPAEPGKAEHPTPASEHSPAKPPHGRSAGPPPAPSGHDGG